ncbi:MAG: retropepsin-like aspartic protease [Acidobacteriota bacterium]
MPFRLVGGAQPLAGVLAWLNESGPYWFALDTGAGPCVLSSKTAARASVNVTDGRPAHGAGSGAAVRVGRLDALRVGDAEESDLQVAVTDQVERIAAAVASLDGILGHAFLGRYDLELDYARDTLALREPGSAAESERLDAAVIPFRLAHPSNSLILVEARFGPSLHLLVAVDTGASTTGVDQESADRLGIARRVSRLRIALARDRRGDPRHRGLQLPARIHRHDRVRSLAPPSAKAVQEVSGAPRRHRFPTHADMLRL